MILRAERVNGKVHVLLTAETDAEDEQLTQLVRDMKELDALVEWDGFGLVHELAVHPHTHSHARNADCV